MKTPGPNDDATRDAWLTALALGELTPAQTAAMEAAMWRDVEARASVEDVRALAEALTFAYAAAPLPSLTPDQQRAALHAGPSLAGEEEKAARLTAFALGELRPSQAEAIAARLGADRVAAQEIEAVGALARELREAYAVSSAAYLSLEQRSAIFDRGADILAAEHAAAESPRKRATPAAFSRPHFPLWQQAAAVAAVLGLLGYAASREWESTERAPLAAQEEPFASRETPLTPPEDPALGGAPPAASSPKLLALLDREKRRPLASTTPAGAAPTVTVPALPAAGTAPAKNETRGNTLAISPRTRPNSSLLPPQNGLDTKLAHAAESARPREWLAFNGAPLSREPAFFFDSQTVKAAKIPASLGRASYDALRQCVRDFGVRPPASLVRPEEIINHFDYSARPAPGQDFAVAIDSAPCPWNESHQLVRVTVASPEPALREPVRLTYFLRLAHTEDSERAQLLFWQGLQALTPRLRAEDSIAVIVWGAARGLVLPPTKGWQQETLRDVMGQWHRGGETAGLDDWTILEEITRQQRAQGGRSHCVIVTDGPLDFIGDPLEQGRERLAAQGIPLAIAELGALRGETQASAAAGEALLRADSGAEAMRLFGREILALAEPSPRSVEITVRFNSSSIHSWRPVGFAAEKSGMMAARRKMEYAWAPSQHSATAGADWTAGKQVTALYEIVPQLSPAAASVLASPGQSNGDDISEPASAALLEPLLAPLNVTVSYTSAPGASRRALSTDWTSSAADWRDASADFRLAASAAAFALRVQNDPAVLPLSYHTIHDMAVSASQESDPFGLRREFAELISAAARLSSQR